MSDPTIVCPHCRTEIKLNESLAAPLLESTKREFEKRLAAKETDVAAREEKLAAAAAAMDEQVRLKIKAERDKIVAEESRKAKQAALVDLDQKARELAELQEILKSRDEKLKQAVGAQAELMRAKRELEDQKNSLELTVETRVQQSLEAANQKAKAEADKKLAAMVAENEKAVRAAADRARLAMAEQVKLKEQSLAELQSKCDGQAAKLAEAAAVHAEALRKQRELDEAKQVMEVTIQQRIDENLTAVKEKAKREVEDAINLKLAEKDLTIKAMQDRIEELKRTSEQGSQQVQGEVLELLLEQQLGAKFPHDRLEPVAKGEHGGDLLHRVHLPTGVRCGSILWETKRTKHWSDGWLTKLREDQQAAKAETAVIVSFALPRGVESFDQIDGIWVIHPRTVVPMATALRSAMIEVHNTRQSGIGQLTKMEMIYAYLTGPQFRLRMEAIVAAFDDMKDDLAKERKAIMKQWQKRESQIERLIVAATGMYGEMQGIAGSSLPELRGMALLDGDEQEESPPLAPGSARVPADPGGARA